MLDDNARPEVVAAVGDRRPLRHRNQSLMTKITQLMRASRRQLWGLSPIADLFAAEA
ncbi:hypothetical protein [Nannocystis punicea]|uniref:Transposase n=1 Tax=Nannocystis punicea TaxID=2995304 RepID=A0ABY7H7Q1_9BACT|nr:hypothetical protein [Nannocystis poenicansa]WAS95287.1 hypothetical protein O0S08_03935 [Nannocystis poenicansa]